MRALGKDIKTFYETIPNGYYHDGEDLEYLDEDYDIQDLLDDQKYELGKWGYIIKDDDENNKTKFETAFKKWKAKQTVTTIVLEIDNKRLDETLEAIGKLPGVKVSK